MAHRLSPDDLGVTEKWLRKALTAEVGEEFTIDAFNLAPAIGNCEYSISITCRITAIVDISGVKRIYHLFVKFFPPWTGSWQMLANKSVFVKEAFVYKVILPEMLRFIKKHSLDEESLPFPRLIYESTVGEDKADFIMLEDLKALGYKMADPKKGHFDVPHCCLVLKELAKLHAAGLAIKKSGDMNLFRRLTALDESSVYTKQFIQLVVGSCMGAAAILKTCPEASRMISRLEKFMKTAQSVMLNIMKSNGNRNLEVITHGDAWPNNFMFKYDNSGRPFQVMLLDLQVTGISSLACDLVLFFATSTTPGFRNSHLMDLLQVYHSALVEHLQRFGLDPNECDFTFQDIKQEYQNCVKFGFPFALMRAIICGMLPEGLFLPGIEFTSREHRQYSAVLVKKWEAGDVTDKLRESVAEIVLDAAQSGLI